MQAQRRVCIFLFMLVEIVSLLEFVDASTGVNKFLFAREVRMALGANFNADVLLCGTRVNHIAACAGNGRFLIVRMYILHICHLFRLICG